MSKKAICFVLVFVAASVTAEAQGALPVDPVYRRAQTLVNDGNAAAGRALIDSMIAVAAPGSNDYAEAVYWRAVLASTAAEAEADYRRIVVDYPRSPRVEDALIRLAQLEIARANYDGALRHLNQLATEHPESPARARASYWSARAMFDKNDIQGGCAATADALSRTTETDTELRNQITYLNQRCAGIALDTAPAAAPPASIPATSPAAPVTVPSAPVTAAPQSVVPPVDSASTEQEKFAAPAPQIT
jgi:TolA-binding protein